jgi:uncharacterized membrane protein YedE/YeeE
MNSLLFPLLGGLMIGAAASLLLVGTGRVAGISGILAGVVSPTGRDRGERIPFLAGFVGASVVAGLLAPSRFGVAAGPLAMLAVAGVLVGYGTRMSGGCTSGHGVCGIGRGSPRSIAATLVFMATGAISVFVLRHVVAP